jgi:RNA polymerase sigma-70 factor (ECF subfamily)
MDIPHIRAQLEQLHTSAYGWAFHCCGRDRNLTEDILQTVYLKVLEGKAQFDGKSALKTWLFAVIRKTAATDRRARIMWGFRFRFLYEAEDHESEESVEASIHASEERALFLRALLRLPRRQREVLHLVFYQDLTIEETAETLGISVGSVRTHYERGKKKLRQALEQTEEFNESRIVRPSTQ